MSQATVSYSGVLFPKSAVYTQTCGVSPDAVSLRMIPQTDSIPTIGDVVMSLGVDSITIKDCLVDRSNIWMTKNGFTGSLILYDRRWRWSRYPSFSAYYNERDANGNIVSGSLASLQTIIYQLLSHIGESSADVSLVSGYIYPEVNARCVSAHTLLADLCRQYGYEISLGFGTEAVKVWPRGVGNALPYDSRTMMFSSSFDPPDPPANVEVCYAPSVAQARFQLAAVGLDLDGIVKPIDSLSYTPSGGWSSEPEEFPNVLTSSGSTAWNLARKSVYRWYMITAYADGTLNNPDGSGTLSSITQLYPFLPKLLETTQANGVSHHPQPRVYGTFTWPEGFGTGYTSGIDEEVRVPYTFDRYRGLFMFDRPMRIVSGASISPANLYGEAAFRIRDYNTRQFWSYVYTATVNSNGQGTHREQVPEVGARTIVQYTTGHVVAGLSTNQVSLDSYAQDIISGASGAYIPYSRLIAWYNTIASEIRTDGLTSQVQFVVTDGDDRNRGCFTMAAQQTNADTNIRPPYERENDMTLMEIRSGRTSQQRHTRFSLDYGND